MNRKEFGNLVKALREEHFEFVENKSGELSYRKWSQPLLAEKASLKLKTVQSIEQGKLVVIDAKTLTKLANALELTTMERKEFFFASLGLDDSAYSQMTSKLELSKVLRTVGNIHLPAFISDGYGDIVAANMCIIHFLNISPEFIERSLRERAKDPAAVNIMRIICSPESGYHSLVGPNWKILAVRNTHFFRRITLRHRSTERFKAIWRSLMKDRNFQKFWVLASDKEEHSNDSDLQIYSHTHSLSNKAIQYIASVNHIITDQGEYHLSTYIPASEQTNTIFSQVVTESGLGWREFF